MLHTCQIYGLGLQSNGSIAGLRGLPAAPQVDVCLWLEQMPSDLADLRPDEIHEFETSSDLDEQGQPCRRSAWLRSGQYLRLAYSDGTTFVIDSGFRTIWATWPAPATLEDTATYLLGPVLGYLLRFRGVTCLHGSAVAIGDRCVALVGPAGAGKSSSAAAFAQFGCPVLSDDIVALAEHDGSFHVQPAYPRVRLWPESAAGLFGSPEALPRITPTWGKRFLDLNGPGYRFQSTPLPLAAVYFLGERSDDAVAPYLEPISAQSAVIAMVSDTYGTHMLDPPRRAREFEVLGRLAGQLPLRTVHASTDMLRMPKFCQMIIDDLNAF